MSVRKRGRPRSTAADAAIHAATLATLVERGYAGTTIEAVAARAGVTRPTVYRRYATRAELLIAAVEASFASFNPQVPDTGRAVEDVRVLLANTIRMVRDTPIGGVVRAIVPELERDESLRLAVRRLLRRRRQLLRVAIRRGVERREFVKGLDVEIAIDALLGAIYLRLLFRGQPLSNRLAGDLVENVLGS